MNLPPERRLPDKEGMLNRVLDAPVPVKHSKPLTTPLAVVASLGVLAVGVGAALLLNRPLGPAAPPATTSHSPSATSSAVPDTRPASTPPIVAMTDGKPVTVGSYTLTVPLEPHEPTTEGAIDGMDYYWVKQCATTAGPVSPAQWVLASDNAEVRGQGSLKPALASKNLAAGECAQGFVSFPKPAHRAVLAFAPEGRRLAASPYGPQIGASVSSLMNEGRATFENFSVEITSQEPTPISGVSGLYAKVCVLKLPADAENGTARVSLDPWWLFNSVGEYGRPLTSGGYSPAFPTEGRYKVGDCAEGWISFATLPAVEIDWTSLSYSSVLGDRAMWNFH